MNGFVLGAGRCARQTGAPPPPSTKPASPWHPGEHDPRLDVERHVVIAPDLPV
jgi:hypothetical protein